MYIPEAFKVSDNGTLYRFIEAYDFATIVSSTREGMVASHVPVVFEREPTPRLRAHFARANHHWTHFDGRSEALIIFHGPHAYVSPTWYASAPAVPTWNYATVHVYGAPRVVEGAIKTKELMTALLHRYEGSRDPAWTIETSPADFIDRLVQATVAFEVPIGRIEGKFKLGQNRSIEDQRGTVAGLERENTPMASALADFMRSYAGLGNS